MKKSLPVYFLFLAIACIVGSIVFDTTSIHVQAQQTENPSQFDTIYNTYIAQYDQYRTIYASYLRARNNYLTYQTLAAQSELIDTIKNLIQIRDTVLLSYVDLLAIRNVSPNYRTILTQEKLFIQSHQSRIASIATLSDSINLSLEMSEHYPILQELALQITGTILLSRVESVEQLVTTYDQKFNAFILSLEAKGHDITVLERGSIEAQNKLLLARQNIASAQIAIAQLQGDPDQYHEARAILFSANQYLKESTTFFAELLQEIKYGNY